MEFEDQLLFRLFLRSDKSTYEIELEFLGKDSMLYKQNINFAGHGELGKTVYECLKVCAKERELWYLFYS